MPMSISKSDNTRSATREVVSTLLLLALLLAVGLWELSLTRWVRDWDWTQEEADQGAWIADQSLQSAGTRSIGSTLTLTAMVSSARPFQTPRLGGTSE